MGKTILTPKQLDFLEFVQTQTSITRNFYLTGGTALSEFYFHHRLSEDIDLFSEKQEVDHSLTDGFLRNISAKLSIVKIKRSQFFGLVSYMLVYADKETLKVAFNYYPLPRIDKGVNFKNLEVDSIHDIAANKVHTMFMKPRTRDYIDLYFIMAKKNYPLNRLIMSAKAKFDWDIDRVTLASQFMKVRELKETEFPKIPVPFDRTKMEKFFLELAAGLKSQIFK